jgi:LysR family nitrogen assimilation transcriptional regulator
MRIEVQEAMNASMLEWVRTERVDFGLAHLSDVRIDDLLVDPLAQEGAVFVQRAEDRPRLDTIMLADVCTHPLVMPARPHHLRELLQTSAEQGGLHLDIRYEIASLSTIIEIVERGIACTVLPYGAVVRYFDKSRITVRRIVDPELRLIVSLIRSRRRALSQAQVTLRGILADRLADEQQKRSLGTPPAACADLGSASLREEI